MDAGSFIKGFASGLEKSAARVRIVSKGRVPYKASQAAEKRLRDIAGPKGRVAAVLGPKGYKWSLDTRTDTKKDGSSLKVKKAVSDYDKQKKELGTVGKYFSSER